MSVNQRPDTTNFDRAGRAAQGLSAAGYVDGPIYDYSVWTLIADLSQLVQRHGWEISEVLNQGLVVYGSQCVEQAWDNDDDWVDELDDAAHRARAEAVLRVCGVPEALHGRILHFMDLFPHGSANDD